jgi:glutamine phosphoribosylpyrophosphate amidotransferase
MPGRIGIFSTGKNNIAEPLFYGLTAFQHRGEDGGGVSVIKNEGGIITKSDAGPVCYLFKDEPELLKGLRPYP